MGNIVLPSNHRLTKTSVVHAIQATLKADETKSNFTCGEIKDVVNCFLDTLHGTLQHPDGVVMFSGMFQISNALRKPRTMHLSEEPVFVSEGRKLKFQVSQKMKDDINT